MEKQKKGGEGGGSYNSYSSCHLKHIGMETKLTLIMGYG